MGRASSCCSRWRRRKRASTSAPATCQSWPSGSPPMAATTCPTTGSMPVFRVHRSPRSSHGQRADLCRRAGRARGARPSSGDASEPRSVTTERRRHDQATIRGCGRPLRAPRLLPVPLLAFEFRPARIGPVCMPSTANTTSPPFGAAVGVPAPVLRQSVQTRLRALIHRRSVRAVHCRPAETGVCRRNSRCSAWIREKARRSADGSAARVSWPSRSIVQLCGHLTWSTALGCLLDGLLRGLFLGVAFFVGVFWRSGLLGGLLHGLLGRGRLLGRSGLLGNRSRRRATLIGWLLDAENDVLVDLQRCDTSFFASCRIFTGSPVWGTAPHTWPRSAVC